MKQAIYSAQNAGHFGLASTHYTHFTSPIRRYPDLTVHRILKDTWQGRGFTEHAIDRRRKELEGIAEHSSVRERVAMEAERDIVDIKKLRFMRDKVGDVFHGVISGVVPFGLFVELQEYFVEGLIHVTNLRDDRYVYHEDSYSLVGELTHRRFRMGDAVTIQIVKVDVARRQMDLMLA
jgi:ribonuclease R